MGQLASAAACWARSAGQYLHKWPHHRVRSRRLTPLELALIVADQALYAAARAHIALPILPVLAETAPDALTQEVLTLSGGGLHRPGPGTIAVLLWGALGAVALGDAVGLQALALHGRPALESLPPSGEGPVARLGACLEALLSLVPLDLERYQAAVLRHARLYESEVSGASVPASTPPWAGALDRGTLALVAAGAQAGGVLADPAWEARLPRNLRPYLELCR